MGFFLFFFACLHLLLSFVIVLPFYLELLMCDYFLHRSAYISVEFIWCQFFILKGQPHHLKVKKKWAIWKNPKKLIEISKIVLNSRSSKHYIAGGKRKHYWNIQKCLHNNGRKYFTSHHSTWTIQQYSQMVLQDLIKFTLSTFSDRVLLRKR